MTSRHRTLEDTDLDRSDRRLLENIRDYGWHVISVAGDRSAPAWSFSVGLGVTFDHPELIVVGLDITTMHAMISNAVAVIENGGPLQNHSLSSEVLEGYSCYFRDVHANWYRPFLGYASWFYRGGDFGCLQCFWPDNQQRFPWDNGFDATCRELQPFLYEPDRSKALADRWLVAQSNS